jgi:sulfatase modifying factor 1
MKHTLISSLGLAILVGATSVTPALAVVIMDWVPVGNAGNAPDPSTGFGSVGYAYNIGKYEVTNSQYAEFLNAKGSSNNYGIFNSSMASYGITQTGSTGSFTYNVTSGFEDKPVVYVSWFDAARFTNWLGHGQGGGDTENGAYTLVGGQTSGIVTVNTGAAIYLPSEDEWYKAAYYNGATSSYSLFPNGMNTITTADANYSSSGSTNVGQYGGDNSFYGTSDQGGNVWEWNDAVIAGSRGLRGGSWNDINYGDYYLRSSIRESGNPSDGYLGFDVGFRVASIPEPASMLSTLALVSSGLLIRRRGKNSF